MTIPELITKVRHGIINLLLSSNEQVVCKYRLHLAETEWAGVSSLARDLSRKLTAHRCRCAKQAIDYHQIEREEDHS